jgi:hypothetical protein
MLNATTDRLSDAEFERIAAGLGTCLTTSQDEAALIASCRRAREAEGSLVEVKERLRIVAKTWEGGPRTKPFQQKAAEELRSCLEILARNVTADVIPLNSEGVGEAGDEDE